ncbi:MAG TPA: non-homologous end-joining DNA ligase [Pyrinomonadaceae bacterium]|nr:non-homologous end-joining DNA ligase [Pyrinomonadaceae bacterium]
MGLETYHKKRDFRATPEPRGKVAKVNRHRFVVQEHHASMLHFDFRLEMGGVLKSWSVRKGPSLDPGEKRLAVATEDHPVEYLKFEGHIPEGNYGAGEHMIWDEGKYELASGTDALEQLEAGRLKFSLHGEKLKGEFNLVRLGGRDKEWLLIKGRDEHAVPGWQLELRVKDDKWEAATRSKKSAKDKAREKSAAGGVKKIKSRKGETEKAVPASKVFKSEDLKGDVTVKVGDSIVSLTNLDKVYWPDDELTKGDLIKYYFEVSKYILPYLKDRPLIMKRYPNGIAGTFFHQHDVNEVPEFVHTETLEVEGHTVDYIIGDDVATLLYMANLGAIERHPWHSRVRNLDRPDWFVFDLDPQGVEWEVICDVAVSCREILDDLGLKSYAKTSGSRGIHVYVPIKPQYSYEEVADFAEGVARIIERENAEVATLERSLKKRKKARIYLDHMQNARGKSVVAPYSVRPKPGATVSAPLEWSEVERKAVTISDFTIRNMMKRLSKKGDLFKPVLTDRQGLQGAFKRLEGLAERPKTKRAGA